MCYIDQIENDEAGVFSFRFEDPKKSAGKYKVKLNVSGLVLQDEFMYKPKMRKQFYPPLTKHTQSPHFSHFVLHVDTLLPISIFKSRGGVEDRGNA